MPRKDRKLNQNVVELFFEICLSKYQWKNIGELYEIRVFFVLIVQG